MRENVELPEFSEDNSPSDIVASRDGIITIIRPFNGTAEQKIGDIVVAGDLLISGIEENGDKTVSFCKADGYVVARTGRSVAVSQKSRLAVSRVSEPESTYVAEIFGVTVPFGKVQKGSYKEKSEVFINGVTLPVSITKCTFATQEKADITLNEEQTKLLAVLRFFRGCTEDFRYLKTESGEITLEAGKNACTLKGNFVCLENIGKEIPMDIEETG